VTEGTRIRLSLNLEYAKDGITSENNFSNYMSLIIIIRHNISGVVHIKCLSLI